MHGQPHIGFKNALSLCPEKWKNFRKFAWFLVSKRLFMSNVIDRAVYPPLPAAYRVVVGGPRLPLLTYAHAAKSVGRVA